jgi:SAM-dependent methyltransferase
MLDLVRLSPRRIPPPGGQDLLRQIARLTDLSGESEVLAVACGAGVGLQNFVQELGAHGSGVEVDPQLVERASDWAREAGEAERFSVQTGRPDDLPYRDGIFDVAVGELGLTAQADPAAAVAELVRVTRPGGWVVLIQLVWKAPVEPGRRDILSSHLGVRPLMLVEWKRLLRESGLEDLHSEDWSDAETAFRPQIRKPFPDFAELFSLPEKLGILRRARGKWGWRGVVTAVLRESEVHRLLTRERILGLDLLLGRKPLAAVAKPGAESGAVAEAVAVAEGPADPGAGHQVGAGLEAAPIELGAGPEDEPVPESESVQDSESASESEAEPDPEPDPAVDDLPLFQKKSNET